MKLERRKPAKVATAGLSQFITLKLATATAAPHFLAEPRHFAPFTMEDAMDSRDRDAISDLFRKLQETERQAGPRDAEAEHLIADEAQRLPGAPYYMAQTIVMQDMALQAKQQEVDDLKRRLDQNSASHDRPSEGGGFLSRVFGGGESRPDDRGSSVPRSGPWGGAQPASQPPQYAQPQYAQPQYAPPPPQYAPQGGGFGRGFGGGGGGGFLAGAAQTAMGVAGGVVLGNAIGSMFGGHGGLFGGAQQPTEVVNETTNIYEGDQGADRQDVADQGVPNDDPGFQDASYDDGGAAGDFDDGGGYDDV